MTDDKCKTERVSPSRVADDSLTGESLYILVSVQGIAQGDWGMFKCGAFEAENQLSSLSQFKVMRAGVSGRCVNIDIGAQIKITISPHFVTLEDY